MAKFSREWRGKVRVYKQTRGDMHAYFIAQAFLDTTDGKQWLTLQQRNPQSGLDEPREFDTAPAAMEAAQKVWSADYAKRIIKTETVFK